MIVSNDVAGLFAANQSQSDQSDQSEDQSVPEAGESADSNGTNNNTNAGGAGAGSDNAQTDPGSTQGQPSSDTTRGADGPSNAATVSAANASTRPGDSALREIALSDAPAETIVRSAIEAANAGDAAEDRARAMAERLQDTLRAQQFIETMQFVQPANLNEAESTAGVDQNEAEQIPV